MIFWARGVEPISQRRLAPNAGAQCALVLGSQIEFDSLQVCVRGMLPVHSGLAWPELAYCSVVRFDLEVCCCVGEECICIFAFSQGVGSGRLADFGEVWLRGAVGIELRRQLR